MILNYILIYEISVEFTYILNCEMDPIMRTER